MCDVECGDDFVVCVEFYVIVYVDFDECVVYE